MVVAAGKVPGWSGLSTRSAREGSSSALWRTSATTGESGLSAVGRGMGEDLLLGRGVQAKPARTPGILVVPAYGRAERDEVATRCVEACPLAMNKFKWPRRAAG